MPPHGDGSLCERVYALRSIALGIETGQEPSFIGLATLLCGELGPATRLAFIVGSRSTTADLMVFDESSFVERLLDGLDRTQIALGSAVVYEDAEDTGRCPLHDEELLEGTMPIDYGLIELSPRYLRAAFQ